jgi:RNA polymerase sigma-70 factor (ECF subfamily)
MAAGRTARVSALVRGRAPHPAAEARLLQALEALGDRLRAVGIGGPGLVPAIAGAAPGGFSRPVTVAGRHTMWSVADPSTAPAPDYDLPRQRGGRPRARGLRVAAPPAAGEGAPTDVRDGTLVGVADAPAGGSELVTDLVGRAQGGDAEAFGRLYDRYLDTVYRYVYCRVGAAALAEDLTSETFLRALRRIESFTWQGRDFGAWLVTIARNLIADHYKSARYRMEMSSDDLAGGARPLVTAGPEGAVLEALSSAALLDAVRRLAPDQQECIALRFLQGLSVADTARIMGKNDGAIKALQYRAVRALARMLPEEP